MKILKLIIRAAFGVAGAVLLVGGPIATVQNGWTLQVGATIVASSAACFVLAAIGFRKPRISE